MNAKLLKIYTTRYIWKFSQNCTSLIASEIWSFFQISQVRCTLWFLNRFINRYPNNSPVSIYIHMGGDRYSERKLSHVQELNIMTLARACNQTISIQSPVHYPLSYPASQKSCTQVISLLFFCFQMGKSNCQSEDSSRLASWPSDSYIWTNWSIKPRVKPNYKTCRNQNSWSLLCSATEFKVWRATCLDQCKC